MPRETKLSKLASINISSKYTKKDLMDYIRTVTDYVNTTIKSRDVKKNEQVLRSAEIIGERYGIKRGVKKRGMLEVGGKKGLLKYNIYGKSHEELLQHARLLKGHLGIDEYTKQGREVMSEKVRKAYEKFKEHNDIFRDTTEEEYMSLTKIFGSLGNTLTEKYDSTNLRNIFIEFYDNKAILRNFVDIARDIVRENQGMDLDQDDLAELLRDKIEELASDM